MDTRGARALSERIAAHQHWRQAEAVRSGEQPSTDPDVQDLLEAGDGYRVYRDGLQKKLVGGRWEISIT